MSRRIRVAAAQYPVGGVQRWEDYAAKLGSWCADAAQQGAHLLLFPEYAPLELLPLFPPTAQRSLRAQPAALAHLWPRLQALYAELAQQHGVFLLPGTLPLPGVGAGAATDAVNRAPFFAPDGSLGWQDKLQRTRYEAETWGLAAGQGQRVFDTPLGRVGIAICYDAEFPLLVRRLVAAGAELILVPACTDTLAGQERVRLACRARAMEGQCYTLHAATVGDLPGNAALDVNIGAAGAFGPVERGFPQDGVLASGTLNAPGWVFADLDLDALGRARQDGEVLLHRDWAAQPGGGTDSADTAAAGTASADAVARVPLGLPPGAARAGGAQSQ